MSKLTYERNKMGKKTYRGIEMEVSGYDTLSGKGNYTGKVEFK